MKIASIVGTRPNFMKIASLVEEFKKQGIDHVLVHTGQHYDEKMSDLFFNELRIPRPNINLNVGEGNSLAQIGEIKKKLKKYLKNIKPDIVVVVGDVNSTLAGAEAAHESGFKIAHVEAGLRSFDNTMPEEFNRVETDKISDFLFTTEVSGNKNLLNEGVSKDKIFFVGNVMIDTLLKHKERAKMSGILSKLNLDKGNYAVLTLHRPANVDGKKGFENIISILEKIQEKIKIVFPVHPRTAKNIKLFGLGKKMKSMRNLIITQPLGYLDFIHLMANSKLVLTDSGGIQEETTVLRIPCITLRNSTERPVTVEHGTNLLVSTDVHNVIEESLKVIDGKFKNGRKIPKLWDGKASQRIVRILIDNFKR